MSRFPSVPLLVLGLLLARETARAEAVLDVSGEVVSVAPLLEVRVVVRNRGDRRAEPVEVVGELLGERREARIAGGVPPGGSSSVLLGFAPRGVRPGSHALTLLLEHPVEGPPDGAGNPPVSSRRAWLLLALGASPGPAVRLAAEASSLDVKGDLPVRVTSEDGEPHRVRLRALTARGLRAEGEGALVSVPAKGGTTARLPLVRAGAPRGSRQEVVLVAETVDEPLARSTVLAATVDVATDPSWMKRLRRPLGALGLALVLAALAFEWFRASRHGAAARRT